MLEIEKILKIITDFSISFNYSPYYYIIPRQFLKFLNSIKIRKKNGNSTEYLFSKSSNYYTCYRKTVIIRRGKKADDTTPEIIVKNVKGNLLSNARKARQHVQSYGTSHVKNRSNMAAEGTLTWINLPCLFLFP